MKQNFEKYYLNELDKLYDLSKTFVKKHPSVSNLLSTPSTDPDVERLLEGVAYLNAFIAKNIDDNYSKIAEYLLNTIYPEFLKPFPASSILKITPNEYLNEKLEIKKYTKFNTSQINKETYTFSSVWDMEVYPAKINISSEKNRIEFNIDSKTDIGKLNFFIKSPLNKAVSIFRLFYDNLINIKIDGMNVSKEKLNFKGIKQNIFSDKYNPYMSLEEYFQFIEKFLILELEINKNPSKIEFIFNKELDFEINGNDIEFFCLPVVNLFEYDLDPIELDYTKECIVLNNFTKYDIYEILDVVGFRNGRKVHYNKFDGSEKEHVYEIYTKDSISDEKDICLSIYLNNYVVSKEILSIKVLAMNKNCDLLKTGDINKPSSNTPELIEFTNITPVNIQVKAPSDDMYLWRFISHVNKNILGLNDLNSFKEMLRLHVFEYGKDKSKVYKNIKKIEGIEYFESKVAYKIYKGNMIQGIEVVLKINRENYLNNDDVFLFGLVIQHFLAAYVGINNFIRVKIKETTSGEELICKEITGMKKLI
ncbi:type VI secretion system baseplate subunit TssF [Nautilia lithotrophica]